MDSSISMGLTVFKSPTINSYIDPNDFMRICRDPEKYFSTDIVFSHNSLQSGKPVIVGKVLDAFIYFTHDKDVSKTIRRWNTLRKMVDFDNIAFVMEQERGREPLTYEIAKEFCELEEKHLLIMRDRMYSGLKGEMMALYGNFHERGIVVEEWFDLVGWVNH